ncbi:TetR/AcrR family transcriptional regulator [Actinoplanes couchii]|uniref:TetR family transcriptional regulator n=1 Tax=Actinoplanes couchii TaxID=403638 RepID=A0ABQ3XRZ4_9ACTN|nr:TetR/AcrR family transcriptional regulator [Actinoplanes couchii]MDR6318478.1 AcrR family transcriptional regulator [Actinoplanes couchii]GID61235.1 TetR family transcriptional regulator [Actinoplanes couchii]
MLQKPSAVDRDLRVDAERNRGRILDAARVVFSEQGLQAPMIAVARRAGVGIATLFRRFPTRDDLITAVFADKMQAYAHVVEVGLADPDPWHGFCRCVETICQMQADDRGFTDVLTVVFPSAAAFEAERNRAAARFTELIEKAKATGKLRDDFVHQDMIMVLMANAGVLAATTEAAQETWRRLVAYLIQSFTAEAAAPLPPPATPEEVTESLVRRSGAQAEA